MLPGAEIIKANFLNTWGGVLVALFSTPKQSKEKE